MAVEKVWEEFCFYLSKKGMSYKRLKAKKDFKPLEGGDECFRNGIFVFNISKLIDFIESNPSFFKKQVVSVANITWTSKNLDESILMTVNMDKPIIFGEIALGKYNLIDGNHRVEKAKRLGIEKLWAYKINIEYLQPFFTSEKAYKAHIDYWNSKLDEL